ncbi:MULTISPECIES: DUF4124 domain-containing protein [Luteimonas]|uniref:DUF4124 domain-containing protein n=1 Tax=Luteimonas TaxID=83614 RepID=UPI000C7D51CF|nr:MULTISPECIES: DUF4124 domain-containing protein [Luteimonas]
MDAPRISTLLLAWMLTLASTSASAEDGVTVYRCTDGQGRIALQDTPCSDGETQRERTMLRPVDGPPPPAPPAAPTAAIVEAPAPQVIVLQAPLPMYRCVTPDGDSYTSDSDAGNPRWVPLWTRGYGYAPVRRGTGDGPRPPSQIEAGSGSRPPRRGGYPGVAGTWIRDDCRPIPQNEVCDLLTDRRSEIRRRFFNAQPTERDRLRGEERSINARLANDCRA